MYKTTLFLVLTAGSLSAGSPVLPFLSKTPHAKQTPVVATPPAASVKSPVVATPPPVPVKTPPSLKVEIEKKETTPRPSCHSPAVCQVGNGVTLSGSYLLWKASENLTPYAQVVTKENIAIQTPNPQGIGSPRGHKESQRADWASGFNVRLGWNSGYDCWDLFADWTWYRNDSKNKISSPTNSTDVEGIIGTENGIGIYNMWGKSWVPGTGANSLRPIYPLYEGPFANASNHWVMDYDTMNLEFGKSFKTKGNLLRPFFGLQGALIERKLSASYTNYDSPGSLTITQVADFLGGPEDPITGFSSASAKSNMGFWGIGPMLGVLDEFRLPQGWNLFGQVGTSLLYGRVHGYDETSLIGILEDGSLTTYYGSKWYHHTKTSFAAHIQLRFGLGWSLCFNQQASEFFLSAAWEQNFWFMTNFGTDFNSGNMNFSLGGLTATAGFRF